MDNLIATYTVNADGTGTASFFLDGIEITTAEYDAIQIAALDRFLDGEVEE
jgi:hypothetical protein